VLPAHRKQWQKMTVAEVWNRIKVQSPEPILVTLSGGNPAMHEDLGQVIALGQDQGYTFAVETQATIAASWLKRCDWVVLSPKPPSSGMKYDRDKLARCIEAGGGFLRHHAGDLVIKIPVFDSADFDFAVHVHGQFPEVPLYLSVGNPNPPGDEAATGDFLKWGRGDEAFVPVLLRQYAWLCDLVLKAKLDAVTLPQLHVLIHGNARGV
jgi:7-carboxy-7-deazaguanine synthase